MSNHLALAILGVVAATLFSSSSLAFPTFVDDVGGGGPIMLVDPEEYDDYNVQPAVVMKRFFTNHPSDYNPMRRPGPIPRGAKREEGVPFHPVPRVLTAGMRHAVLAAGDDMAESEGYIESGRQKKQTRAATLIFRLGSLGMRRKPTVPPGPTTA